MKKGKRLATVKEACAYARLGATSLYQKIGEGSITAYKLGHKTVVDLDSIDAALEPWGSEERRPARKP